MPISVGVLLFRLLLTAALALALALALPWDWDWDWARLTRGALSASRPHSRSEAGPWTAPCPFQIHVTLEPGEHGILQRQVNAASAPRLVIAFDPDVAAGRHTGATQAAFLPSRRT